MEDNRNVSKLSQPKYTRRAKGGFWRKTHMKHFKNEKRKRAQSNRNYLRLWFQNERKYEDGTDWSFDRSRKSLRSWRNF